MLFTKLPQCTLSEIINEFNDTKSSADSGNVTNQLRCFGLGEPIGLQCLDAALKPNIQILVQNIPLVVTLTMEDTQILA